MSEVRIGGYRPGALGRVTVLHATYYHEQWGFGLFFEARVAADMAAFLQRFDEARDGFWVAMIDDEIVGSIAIDGIDAATAGAHLRWFILDPDHQGHGLGRKLLTRALDHCRARGFGRVRLSTFAGLDAARHLYESLGFVLTEEAEGTQWGSAVTEQTFVLDLAG